MNWADPVWALLAFNAGIAVVLALGMADADDSWRQAVRNWLGGKAVWIAALALYWMFGWIGFQEGVPAAARAAYIAVLLGFSAAHAWACKAWLRGEGKR